MKRMIGISVLVVLGIALFLSASLFFMKHRSAKPEEFLKKARLEAQNKAYYAASVWCKLLIRAFPKSSQVSYAYLKEAEFEEKAGYPELAYGTYQKYDQAFPDRIQEPDFTGLLGRLAFAAGDWDNAILNFKKLQAEQPRFEQMSEVKRKLAQSYFEKSKLYPQGEKRNEHRRLAADLFFLELRRTPNEETLKMVAADLQFIHQWIEEGQMEIAAEALVLIEKRIQTLNDKLVFFASSK
jgi:tetratricopeptide (TPR) repeat protein